MGVYSVAADGNQNAPLRKEADEFIHVDLKDEDGMLAAAREIRARRGLDGVMTAGTDFSTTVAFVARALGLPGHSYEAALNASDKARMRSCFEKAGVHSPRFRVIDGGLTTNHEREKECLAPESVWHRKVLGTGKCLAPEKVSGTGKCLAPGVGTGLGCQTPGTGLGSSLGCAGAKGSYSWAALYFLRHPRILSRDKGPFVVKPCDNMGGRGCVRVDSPAALEEAVSEALKFSRRGQVIVEEYMEGPEFSVDAIVHNGRIVICGFADRHIFFSPHFVEMGHTMPSNAAPKDREALLNCFAAGVRALGLTEGAAKGDLKLTPRGPAVGEIAARLSGGFMSGWTYPYSSGVEVTKAAIQIALGEEPDIFRTVAVHDEKCLAPETCSRGLSSVPDTEACLRCQTPRPVPPVPDTETCPRCQTPRPVPLDLSPVPDTQTCPQHQTPAQPKNWTCAERAFISIPGIVREVRGLDEARAAPFVRDVFPRVDRGARAVFPRNNVEKCGNVIAAAPERAEAVRAAEEAARKVLIILESDDAETRAFLDAPPDTAYPPSAYRLTKEQIKAVGAGDYRCLFGNDSLRDWAGRTVEETLGIVARLGFPLEYLRLPKSFWFALIRGGYQGALFAAAQ
jgi:biotin carboxylase